MLEGTPLPPTSHPTPNQEGNARAKISQRGWFSSPSIPRDCKLKEKDEVDLT